MIFHDAWANAYPQLEVDVATCHFPKYYSDPGKNPPGDWQEPNPVTFLTIAPGTQFTFCLSGADQALVDQALQWLFGGLYWLGAGAKTAAGYGAFVLDEGLMKQEQLRQEVARNEAAQRAEEKRLEAVTRAEHEQAAQGLTVIAQSLKADEILVVAVPSDPSQSGSRTGYTLLYASSGWTRGPLFSYKKDPLPKGLVFKLIKKGTTNDKGQIEVQGPVVPTNAPTPI